MYLIAGPVWVGANEDAVEVDKTEVDTVPVESGADVEDRPVLVGLEIGVRLAKLEESEVEAFDKLTTPDEELEIALLSS